MFLKVLFWALYSLCTLYINNLINVSKLVDFILFADDTNLFVSHDDPSYLISTLNSELNRMSDWFCANKLPLNLKTPKFMVFKPRQKKHHFYHQIFINEQKIEQVKEAVFLGVLFDENLSWESHIFKVATKISKSIGFIHRSFFFLFKSSLRTLYFSFDYPYLH